MLWSFKLVSICRFNFKWVPTTPYGSSRHGTGGTESDRPPLLLEVLVLSSRPTTPANLPWRAAVHASHPTRRAGVRAASLVCTPARRA